MRSLVLALLVGSAAAQDSARVTFRLDDLPLQPDIVSLEGMPESPRPGDLARVRDDLWVTLDETTQYGFRYPEGDLSRLMLGDRLFAVRVFRGADGTIVNPLETMTEKEVRGLRGICLLEWDEAILRRAEMLDPLATLTLMCDKREMPALPRTLERLCVLGCPSAGMDRLAKLTALRAFIGTDHMGTLDWSSLAAPRLRAAVAPGARPGDLSRFPELRMLDLSYAWSVSSVEFVAKMPHLRVLRIPETEVTDLRPLAGHPALVRVAATGAPIGRLPAGPVPALRQLVAYSRCLPEQERAAFRTANPQCSLECDWEAPFRAAVAGCDRLVVTKEAHGEVLFEVRDAVEIRDLVAKVRIDEANSGYHCRCDGGPVFEFCKGDETVAVVPFHHATALWYDAWPGLGELTPESAGALCEWLAGHGVPGPLEDHRKNVARDKAWAVRAERSRRLVGKEVWERILYADSGDETAAAFATVADTDEGRICVLFSLLGCHEGGWDLDSPFDTPLYLHLHDVDRDTIRAAVRRAVADPWACAGAARWALGKDGWKTLDAATLAETLPALARSGLAHPRPYSRRRTLIMLSKIGGEAAVSALRTALAGVAPRPLAADEQGESGTGLSRGGDPDGIRGAKSERAIAAFFLAELGDAESLPAMRDLPGQLQGDDRALVERAIGLLEAGR